MQKTGWTNYPPFLAKCGLEKGFTLDVITMGQSIAVREGFTKKSSCFFGFCPNYLDLPPFPKFGQNVLLFLNANVPKNLGRGLSLPLLPQIDPIYTVCKKWTKNLGSPPPIIWTKSKRTATFFHETFPYCSNRCFCRRWQGLANLLANTTSRHPFDTLVTEMGQSTTMFLCIRPFSAW